MKELHIIFDGPPGAKSGCFVETEDGNGNSVRAGEWVQRPDGLWALVIKADYFEERGLEIGGDFGIHGL